jgi:hypothetical protein
MSKANLHQSNLWKSFPAARTVAYYHPAAQFIELSEFDSAQLHRAIARSNPEECVEVLPILFHEIRHWIDHIATVWGQEHLISLYNAIHSYVANDLPNFHRIASYWRLQNRDNYPDYYSTIDHRERPWDAEDRWIYQYTSGLMFASDGRPDESSPIFFTRYHWSTGQLACRVPISVSALLESSAMHFELATESIFINQMSHDQRIVEATLRETKRKKALYSPDLGVYSTAVHLIANRMQLASANQAYPLASALASLCLNLTDNDFLRIRIPKAFEHWGDRNKAAICRSDRGYAYLAIAFHANPEHINDPRLWVDMAAQAAGLPSLEGVFQSSRLHLETLSSTALPGPHSDRLNSILQAGKELFGTIGIIPTVIDTIESLDQIHFPPVVCSDLKWHRFGRQWTINDINVADSWWNTWSSTETKFSEFIRACG